MVKIVEGSSVEVYGKLSEDSLVFQCSAVLEISTGVRLLIGNSSVLVILPSKTVSIGERSKLSIGDHMYCLVLSDVAIAEYTKMEINSGQGNPGGICYFLTPQYSGDNRQLKARYGIERRGSCLEKRIN